MKNFMFIQILVTSLTLAICANIGAQTSEENIQTEFSINKNDVSSFSYIDRSSQAEMTRTEAAKILFEFIYPGKDYYSLTTYYPHTNDGRLGVYKYVIPSNQDQRVMIVEYKGIQNGHHIFEMYSESYSYDGSGNRTYSHSNHISAYAINISNKEVIPQRWDDENGVPIYNEKYSKLWESTIP